MKSLLIRPLPRACALASLTFFAGACGDDEDGTSTGGAGGGAGRAGSGGASASGGTGGGGQTSVIPDPLKECTAAANPSVPELQLTELVSGLDDPIFLSPAPGDDARLFVVEQSGTVRILRDGALVAEPFLDLGDKVETGGEKGLLGLAFHPSYASNGRFFVFYSTLAGGAALSSRVAEYTVSPPGADQADPNSERVLVQAAKPEDNHNGGDIVFGPDGFLYIGLGDGGGGGDQHGPIGNGQKLDTLLGKILRIDVDAPTSDGTAYAIPAGNPALGDGARPEIWSYGWRNPWRFSFDACTGEMYVADVGQGTLEEVDVEPANSSGRNYGWRLMEGTNCFSPDSGCDPEANNLTLPVATYGRELGQSITGGYVYRGHAIESLRGTYLYADYQTAAFFALRMNGGALAQGQQNISNNLNPGRDVRQISSFGQDNAGELYVLSLAGSVYRIDAE
jgi:glucose/arabinose dehydrogenase